MKKTSTEPTLAKSLAQGASHTRNHTNTSIKSWTDPASPFPWATQTFPHNVWEHSPECLVTLPGMFGNIPLNVWEHSPKCLTTLPGMLGDIPGTFGNTPQNACCFLTKNSKKQPPQVFYETAVLESISILTGKHLCWSVILIKLQTFSPATLLKGDNSTGVFLSILRNF